MLCVDRAAHAQASYCRGQSTCLVEEALAAPGHPAGITRSQSRQLRRDAYVSAPATAFFASLSVELFM
eukprot:6197822-Pleurochrysis_carterae.AAC.3